MSNIIDFQERKTAKEVEQENQRAMLKFEEAEQEYFKIKGKEIEKTKLH